ncbi:MAG: calcium-binding protein [Rhodocyclaceae bacterium]
MTDFTRLFSDAELALAAYARLLQGPSTDQSARLEAAGFSAKQAEEFARRYPVVVTQFNDTVAEGGLGTSFSATVFKDSANNLTLAIRGTAELIGSPNDILPTDANIGTAGAGYDQIVAMWNWWQRVSNPAATTVTQYRLVATPADLSHSTWIAHAGLWLEWYTGTANGSLKDALAADADWKLDLTGHSLGGHLAMAFGSIFPSASNQITVFNAPGFLDDTDNHTFFALLGGAIPNGANTTNVIADEANVGLVPWSGIAGLHSRPGTAIDISIENQWQGNEPLGDRPGALNHSQQILTDALAVYATLAKLDPNLSTTTFKPILQTAAVGTSASLERIVDVFEKLLGINSTRLPSGNANRDALYRALYGLQGNALFKASHGRTKIENLANKSADGLVGLAKDGDIDALAYRYALKELNPFAILGLDYSRFNANGELKLYDKATGQGELTDEYLADRAAFLAWKNRLAQEDADASTTAYNKGSATDQWFRDNASNLTLNLGSGAVPADKRRFIFDGDNAGTLSGGSQSDRLYGGGGNDVLYGHGGRDHLEGGAGNDWLYGGDQDDTLIGGAGDDRLEGGKGFDTYIVGQGRDTLVDEDGLGVVKDGQGRIIAGAFIRGADGRYVWAGDAQVTATHNSPLTLTLENGAEIVVENYDEMGRDGLGLRLVERPGMETAGLRLGDRPTWRYPERSGEPPLRNGSRYSYGTRDAEGREEIGITHADIPEEWLNARVVESERRVVEATSTYVVYETTRLVLAYSLFEDTLAPIYGDDIVPREDVFRMVGGPVVDWRVESGLLNDFVVGGAGNDVIAGGEGSDVLMASNGNDLVFGGDVVDVAAFIEASRTAAGTGARGDWMSGGRGRDTVVGTHADDVVFGGGGEDYIVGGAGNDVLNGDDNYITNSTGQTNIIGLDIPENFLAFRTYDWSVAVGDDPFDTRYSYVQSLDTAARVGGADVIFGGAGNDRIHGLQGNDYLYGENGNDVVAGDGGADFIFGGDGNDQLTGERNGRRDAAGNPVPDPGDDFIDGGAGEDFIQGEDGNDYLLGGDGNDELWGDARYAAAVSGHDRLEGGGGNDLLVGGGGNDFLDGGNGNDTLHGDTADAPASTMGDDRLFGGAGTDSLRGYGGNDWLDGGDGNDALFGDEGDDRLFGGDGSDYLEGGAGNDRIEGGAGDDTLIGGAGDDFIEGGAGADYLEGGAGDDAYVVDGNDTLADSGGARSLTFANAVVGALALSQDTGADGSTYFMLTDTNSGDSLRMLNGQLGNVRTYEFADGQSFDHRELMSTVASTDLSIHGTHESDSLIGGRGNDYIVGGEGDDYLEGGGGQDALNGGEGADRYIIHLSGDLDRIDDRGSDEESYRRFHDDSPLDERFRSRFGGKWAVWWGEGPAFDTYRETVDFITANALDLQSMLDSGDLQYVPPIGEAPPIPGNDYSTLEGLWRIGAIEADTVAFGPGVTPQDLRVEGRREGEGTWLRITLPDGSGADIRLARVEDPLGMGIERFEFADGGELTLAQMIALAPPFPGDGDLAGTDEADQLNGSDAAERIFGLGGDDFIAAFEGDDFLAGGAGNDTLIGGLGSDVYWFGPGDGVDTIGSAEGAADVDVLHFGAGIAPSEVSAGMGWEGLRLAVGDDGDAVVLAEWFERVEGRIGRVEFADGTVWDSAALEALAARRAGSEDNDVLWGTSGDDVMTGAGGDDQLFGGAGSDVLAGGPGYDNLDGGAGDDVYLFGRGDGEEVIFDSGPEAGVDVLRFAAGIGPEDIVVMRDDWSIYLALRGSDDVAVLDGWFSSPEGRIERVEFADGTVWEGASLEDRLQAPGLLLKGTAGDDVLAGGDGDDLLAGGAGSDRLAGGAGSDTYRFGLGDGIDRIVEARAAAGEDTLRFGPGITPDMLSLGLGSLLIRVGTAGDALHLEDFDPQDAAAGAGIERFVFADGSELEWPALLARGFDIAGTAADDALSGTSAVDRISGGAGNDALTGGPGNDRLDGGAGIDLYAFSRGDGNDVLIESPAGSEASLIAFGEGVARADLRLREEEGNLVIDYGPDDSLRIGDWSAEQAGLWTLHFGDGTSMSLQAALNVDLPPVTAPDAAHVIEDRKLLAWGNVLANDRDPEGDPLSVADPGIRRGEYGRLALLPNGAYAYVLDDCSPKVQGLGAGEKAVERFSYLATDGLTQSAGELDVTIQGTNDAPVLATPLANVQLAKGKAFSWQLPAGSFADRDRNDTLSYTATLANGKPLPAWLAFDAATQAFSGTAPAHGQGTFDVRVVASDGHGEGSTASDVFRISVGNKTVLPKGNAGVGNGMDPPPPGHHHDWNDGPGTGPGHPGRRGGEAEHAGHEDWVQSWGVGGGQGKFACLDADIVARLCRGFGDDRRDTEARGDGDVFRRWAKMERELAQLLDDGKRPSWLEPAHGADLRGLALISHAWQSPMRGGGADPISLAAGADIAPKSFRALQEGFARLG